MRNWCSTGPSSSSRVRSLLSRSRTRSANPEPVADVPEHAAEHGLVAVPHLGASAGRHRSARDLSQQGQSLAYSMSNIDDVFRQRFGTYNCFRSQNITGGSFSQAYSSWSTTQRDTIASTLKTANLTADQITADGNILKQLQAQSASADGQMRALQVGHSLASLQADQMMKLRALIAQQTVMFGEVFGRQAGHPRATAGRRGEVFQN